MVQNLPVTSVRNDAFYEQHHFSATKAQMNMKVSVLERGQRDLSTKGSISLKQQPCLYRTGKKRG